MEFDDYLPNEATVEVTISGIMPTFPSQFDWVPISLWSRRGGTFYEETYGPGGYAFIKTQDGQLENGKQSFRFFSTPFYGWNPNDPDEKHFATSDLGNPPNWDPNAEYTFRITWNQDLIWLQINGQTYGVHSFKNEKYNNKLIEGFAYLLLGKDMGYDGVAGPFYKDLKVYIPDSDISFQDLSKSSGAHLDRIHGGQAASWADVNQDGLQDCFVANYQAANALFIQTLDGQFNDEASIWGVNDVAKTFSGCFADFDKDGAIDLFVSDLGGANKLMMNTGTSFQEHSSFPHASMTNTSVNALALDVENDGDLDIFVSNHNSAPELYINDGSANFTYRSLSFPSGGGGRSAAADVENDGDVDIFYLLRNQPAVLLINNGQGQFTNRANEYGLNFSTNATAPVFADMDNDGDMDLFVTINSRETIYYFENQLDQGQNAFTDNTQSLNLDIEAYSVVPTDVNRDGYLDLYVPARHADVASRLYRNVGDGTLELVQHTGAERILADGRSASVADYNQDGWVDFFVVPFGGSIDDQDYGRHYLLQNTSSVDNNYISIAVHDSSGIINGIGTKLEVYEAGRLQSGSEYRLGYRQIYPNQGYQGQHSLVQHFGVGTASRVDIRATLPGGEVYTFSGVSTNQQFHIRPLVKDPYRLRYVSGDNQSGQVGEFLADSLTVKVESEEGDPILGHPVRFEVTSNNATLDDTDLQEITVSTDQYGLARVAVKLGTEPGIDNTVIQITADHEGAPLVGSPMTLYASTETGDPDAFRIVSGNNQTGTILQPCPDPLVVSLTDRFQNPISGYPVAFRIAEGGGLLQGNVTEVDTVTDDLGLAQIRWKLGATAGTQAVEALASFEGLPIPNSPLRFEATAEQPELRLLYISGDDQAGVVNQTLPQPFVVRVLDYNDTPVFGETITFRSVSGGGKFTGQSQVEVNTGQDGYASVRATTGFDAGDSICVYQAELTGAEGSPVTFYATARPGQAAQINPVQGDGQSVTAGRILADPFQIEVTDGFGNPIPDVSVQFAVNQGGGSFGGSLQVDVVTNADGIATAPPYRAGTDVGTETVLASAEGLDISPAQFLINVQAGVAARLNKTSGDNQRGEIGQPLSQPLVVTVTDSFSNPISNQSVTFSVIQGGGSLSGEQEKTLTTNSNGEAQVTLILGAENYLNKVSASSEYLGSPLINSPVVFQATTGAETPDSLIYVSGNEQTGRINSRLPEPFRVRVTDSNGIPVPEHPVTFVAITPGAHFSNQKELTVTTNNEGIAEAYGSLGSNIGDRIYVYEVRAYHNSIPLYGRPEWPLRFFASGRYSTGVKIVNQTPEPDQLVGTVGTVLADSLKVKVLDPNDQPAAGQPVTFEVTEGQALLEGNISTRVVYSDERGIAAIRVLLGTQPDESYIRASANDGIDDLENSPLQYHVTTVIGPPFAENCTIVADTQAVANGQDMAEVTVTLRDAYQNPVPGKTVNIYAQGLDVTTIQPSATTDELGRTSGSLSSVRAGKAEVWTMVDGEIVPRDTVSIRFSPGPPAQVSTFGSGKIGEMGKMLSDSVGVIVVDAFGNPVANVPVEFQVVSGGGSLLETGPFSTNDRGRAWVHWILGNPGEQFLQAEVPGVTTSPKVISAIALASEPASIERIAGNQQIGQVNSALADSFKVLIRDDEGRPIPGLVVEFSVVEGSGSFLPTRLIKTDNDGIATVLFKTGYQTGNHRIRAQVNGLDQQAFFDVVVQQEPQIRLKRVSGNQQNSRPGLVLEEKLVVQAFDAFDRPLEGIELTFAVTSGGGAILESHPVETDNQGLARATWRLGNLGEQNVQVSPVNMSAEPVLFEATLINGYPVLETLPDTSVKAGETVMFVVNATDPDDDPISYGTVNLPDGASFDSTGSRLFSWTPGNNQSGPFNITFTATDPYGAADSMSVRVDVTQVNRAPMIYYHFPVDTLLSYTYGEVKTFQIRATDPDDDELSYEWRANGKLAGSTNESVIVFTETDFQGDVTVTARVTDGKAQTGVRWHLTLNSTAVELSLFNAREVRNHVMLTWKTRSEDRNAGFHVYKSAQSDGPYDRLTDDLIPPRSDGQYTFIDNNISAGQTVYYKLKDIDRSGHAYEHGPIQVTVSVPTEVRLAQNYPNPFNPSTTITIALPERQEVSLTIYNVSGQKIKTLVNGRMSSGTHQVVWDGTDQQGRVVPSGVYLYRLKTPKKVLSKKLMFAK
jgi:hypothetical protein